MGRKVKYEFDPFELVGIKKSDLDPELREGALRDVADYVLEAVLEDTAAQRSAVTGRPFPKLSTDYAKAKKAKGGKPIPNLELEGDMLQSLTVVRARGTKLRLTVGDDQGDKADGHNNHSGESSLPERKFIPNADDDETFRPAIRQGIKDIVLTAVERQIELNTAPAESDEDLESLVERGVKINLRQFLDD